MSTLPEISVVHPQPAQVDDPDETHVTTWSSVELPRMDRPTPTTLIVLAVCAGVGALTLGGIAGVSTLSKGDEPAVPPATTSVDSAGQRALSLLAKPSTERVAFNGSGGSLVLAVGSGGRAAILVRGFDGAVTDRPYFAWVVGSGQAIRAARLDGTESAVFLDVPLAPRESVVVARNRPGRVVPVTQLVARRN